MMDNFTRCYDIVEPVSLISTRLFLRCSSSRIDLSMSVKVINIIDNLIKLIGNFFKPVNDFISGVYSALSFKKNGTAKVKKVFYILTGLSTPNENSAPCNATSHFGSNHPLVDLSCSFQVYLVDFSPFAVWLKKLSNFGSCLAVRQAVVIIFVFCIGRFFCSARCLGSVVFPGYFFKNTEHNIDDGNDNSPKYNVIHVNSRKVKNMSSLRDFIDQPLSIQADFDKKTKSERSDYDCVTMPIRKKSARVVADLAIYELHPYAMEFDATKWSCLAAAGWL